MPRTETLIVSAPAITSVGVTDWIRTASLNSNSLFASIAMVAPAGVTFTTEYSDDGTNIAGRNDISTATSTAGNYQISLSPAYAWARIRWVAGTATSLTFSVHAMPKSS